MPTKRKNPFTSLLRPSFVLVIAIAIVVVSFGFYYATISSGKRVLAFAAMVCIALIVQFSAYAISKGRGFANPELLAFTIALASWGMIFMLVFPPFSVPDEIYHYIAAYQLSDVMMFFGQGGDGHLPMRAEDLEVLNNESFAAVFLTSASYSEVIRGLLDVNVQGDLADYAYDSIPANLATNPFQDRLAPAIGITIGRLFGLNAVLTFYCGRTASLVVFVILAHYAVKILPLGKPIMMTVSFLPMTLHLAGSYSYDSFTIAMAFLFFSMLTCFVVGKGKISTRHIVITAVIGGLLAPCKVVYSLMAFAVLLAKPKRFKSKRTSRLAKALIIGVTFASLFLFKIADLIPLLGQPTSDTPNMNDADSEELYTISFIAEHPGATLAVYWNTIMGTVEHLARTMIGGSLGWFQGSIAAPYYIVVALYVVLFFSCIPSSKNGLRLSSMARVVFVAIPILCWLAVMTSMFTGWTPNTATSIYGLQGRYFIPVLPMLLIALTPKRMGCGYNLKFWAPFFMCSVNAVYVIHIVGSSLLG